MSKFLSNLMLKIASGVPPKPDPFSHDAMNRAMDDLVERTAPERNAARATLIGMPIGAGAAIGGIGGLLPGGSGVLSGAARGAGAAAGAELGAVGASAANAAIGPDHPVLSTLLRLGLTGAGGYAGYHVAKKLTKTREEQLRDAMLKWYGDENNVPADMPTAVPKIAASSIPLIMLRLDIPDLLT